MSSGVMLKVYDVRVACEFMETSLQEELDAEMLVSVEDMELLGPNLRG